uniref:Uncharacterized protein n=1 Tax=Cacopsylla melanoneura TaxID=428564 RepID=A0A8D8QKA7_9HEMI
MNLPTVPKVCANYSLFSCCRIHPNVTNVNVVICSHHIIKIRIMLSSQKTHVNESVLRHVSVLMPHPNVSLGACVSQSRRRSAALISSRMSKSGIQCRLKVRAHCYFPSATMQLGIKDLKLT